MASVKFNVAVSPDQLKRMASVLDAKQMKSAVYQAVKRTADAVRQVVIDNLHEHSAMSAKYARRSVTVVTPQSPDVPEGFVVVSSRAIPLIGFDAHASKRSGVSVEAGENKSPISLHHAFEAVVKNRTRGGDIVEHLGIFLREKVTSRPGIAEKVGKGSGMGVAAMMMAKKGALKPRRGADGVSAGFAERLPLSQIFGPTAAEIVKADEVQKAVEPTINAILMKNIDSQIDRFVKEKSQ